MKTDYHIHSEFSSDSSAEMDQIADLAIAKRYNEIAFTDHFDLVPSEIAIYGVPSYYRYTKAIERLRRKYQGIKILKGVEIGEYHNCYETVDAILEIDPPDIKIGAIHILPPLRQNSSPSPSRRQEKENISLPLKHPVTREMIRSYYLENLKLVRHGNFHILAHLGVYKRYLSDEPEEECAEDLIAEIFAELIKKKIALEVNLSGLRKQMNSLVPGIKHLKMYRDMGGELVTVGSDTHHKNDFDLYYDETVTALQDLGFRHINDIGLKV